MAVRHGPHCCCRSAPQARGTTKPVVDPRPRQDEIKPVLYQYRRSSPATSKRYLLQKQELEKLQADADQRIATMTSARRNDEDWLKRRDRFPKTADPGLVDIYKNMRPDAAEGEPDQVKIGAQPRSSVKLSPRQSSLVLAEMDPQKAAVVTNITASASDRIHRSRRTLMNMRLTATCTVVVFLAGCSPQALKEIGRAPAMSLIGSGWQYASTPQMLQYPTAAAPDSSGLFALERLAGGSLSRMRALNVGDILTANNQINDSEELGREDQLQPHKQE